MPKQDRTAVLLRLLYQLVAGAKEADLKELEDGTATLIILKDAGVPRPFKKSTKGAAPVPSKEDLAKIVSRLQAEASREGGLSVLNDLALNRRGLEALARVLDVPVLADDNLARLQGRIIESAIGARLNSEAIKGR